MGEDDGLQEAGEGVIESNRKTGRKDFKCVCVSEKALLYHKEKKNHLVFPCATFSEAGPQ